MSYVLGIDTSTTATKAVLVDRQGRVAGVAASTYGVETPNPLWSEQHPDLWWTATRQAIRTVLAETGVDGSDVAAVGLTGQMHGLVALDDAGTPLRPAMLWNDQRTGAECDEIRTRVGFARLVAISGNDALTGFTAPKILWMRNHEPELFARIRHVLLPKDFVRLRLTGEYACDRAGGGGTILFDHAARTWSPEILAALDIPPEWLPPTFEGPEVTGTVSGAASNATGLAEGTPVVAGGGDQAAAAVGTGAVAPGIVTVSLGTSGVVFATTDGPAFDPLGTVHAFPHAVPGRWHMMGVTLAAAGSLAWLHDAVAPDRSYDELSALAAATPPGAAGLLFLPYLSGERTPHADPLARGAFVGLTTRHQLGHLVRAVMEGVAFSLLDALDVMVDAGVARPRQIRISGGGARSEVWRQIVADVLTAEVVTVTTTEGAAHGAAVLAAVGAGWHDSVETAAAAWVHIVDATRPEQPAVYPELHDLYRSLYPALKPAMHRLSAT
jgi:xylulokinase